jgi:hypothetical protein
MRPYAAELMRLWPISTRVNKPENDDEAIVELLLPRWGESAEWPPPRMIDPALFAPVTVGDRCRYSDRWWEVHEEEAAALRERQEREAAEREAKALENYHGPRWWEGERA